MPYKNPADRNTRQRQRRAAAKAAGTTPLPPAAMSGLPVGAIVGDWAEANLKVPTGPLRGQPFRVPDWQRDWLSGAMAPGIREAALSCGRKNGKSGIIAALLLAHMCGPLHREQWRAVVVSETGRLAQELRGAIEQTAEISGLTVRTYRSPLPGSVHGPGGTRVDILASDRSTGHALGCDLAIIDDGGLIPESGRDLWDAIYSSLSGRDGRMLIISIKGNSPMFAELAQRAGEKAVYWKEYAAAEGAALDDRVEWENANPGLRDGIKAYSYMQDAAERAKASVADARNFRSHELNLPGNPTQENLCDVADWMALETHNLPERSGRVVLGFDAGGSSSMTAAVALWESGLMEAWAAFPDNPPLIERSRSDGMGQGYLTMQRLGELRTYEGRITPVGAFLADVALDIGTRPVAIAADQYRRADVADGLTAAGLSGWDVAWRRMGTGPDGSQDVRAFQRLVLAGGFRVKESALIRRAIGDSLIRYDANGNPSLDKKKQKARIDVLQAGVLAAGLFERMMARPAGGRYLGAV